MAPQRIFLIRHAQSTFNRAWDESGKDPGAVDPPLTALGHAQVRLIAPRVAGLDVQLVVTSPATRALQTTMGLFEHCVETPAILVNALVRDRFAGDSCDIGRPPADLKADFPAIDFAHIPEDWWRSARKAGEPAIESHEAFATRVATLRAWIECREERSILIVGHDGTFHVLTGHRLANAQLVEWAPATASMTPVNA